MKTWTSLHRNTLLLLVIALTALAACGGSNSPETIVEAEPPQPAIETSSQRTVAKATQLKGFFPAQSVWIENRRSKAFRALADLDIPLLVTPVQGGANNFDPIERSLITRMVSDRISSGSDLELANPNLVIQYYGLHHRKFRSADYTKTASNIRAKSVLTMHAEHDRAGRFKFTASVLGMPSMEELRTKTWSNLEYSDAAPPSVAIDRILDEIAELAVNSTIASDPRPESVPFDPDEFLFPLTLDDLKEQSADSELVAAAYLQLLGMLHPSGTFNESRNHLFERSLVKLRNVSADQPYRDYFVARAYAYLDRRPAALAALVEPTTRHGRALIAFLNGNLPPLQAEFEQMGTSAIDFMTYRDLLYLEDQYGQEQERDVTEHFVTANPNWAAYIYRAMMDTSEWANFSAATIKLGLEALLPSDAPSLQSAADQAAVTGDAPSELELTRMVVRHIDAFGIDEIKKWAESRDSHVNVSEIDVIEWASATIVANLLRRNNIDLNTRKLPETVIQRIGEYDALLSGHPEITLQLARAQSELAKERDGVERSNLNAAARTGFQNGFGWTGQMTKEAVYVAKYFGLYFQSYLPAMEAYEANVRPRSKEALRYSEWPQGKAWFWITSRLEAEDGATERCIEYTMVMFDCVNHKIASGEERPAWTNEDRDQVLASVEHRFEGNPLRAKLAVQLAIAEDDGDALIQEMRARVVAGYTDWPSYRVLGRELKRRGDYRGAQEAWLSYPPFRDAENGVELGDDHHANYTGSQFYWVGQHELAVPFFQISAWAGTGSGSQMSSGARLGLIAGDYEAAEYWSAARVRRYSSKYGMRDLQQILHITGQADLAWGLFEQSQTTGDNAQAWSGPLVGHRIEAATTDDILAWIKEAGAREAAQVGYSRLRMKIDLAARHLLLAGTMDRVPGPELGAAISQIKVNGQPAFDSNGIVWLDGRWLHHDASIPVSDRPPAGERGEVIASRYEMLANAMAAFLSNEHESAFELFDRAAHYYYLDEYLPYYTFSALIVGRAEHIPMVLAAREPALKNIRVTERVDDDEIGYRFDEDLSYAVLAAFDGRHDEAIAGLHAALNNRPYVEERSVYPYYQVVELAELLFAQTGEKAYVDLALDLARRHTVVLPMYSWAYFVVATHSESEAERTSAAASGIHLDPLSHRGLQLPPELVQKAKKLLEEERPPYLRRSSDTANIAA